MSLSTPREAKRVVAEGAAECARLDDGAANPERIAKLRTRKYPSVGRVDFPAFFSEN
jgi:hypothetical protein